MLKDNATKANNNDVRRWRLFGPNFRSLPAVRLPSHLIYRDSSILIVEPVRINSVTLDHVILGANVFPQLSASMDNINQLHIDHVTYSSSPGGNWNGEMDISETDITELDIIKFFSPVNTSVKGILVRIESKSTQHIMVSSTIKKRRRQIDEG